MPAKDLYHNQVKNALIKDGWTITNDPLHVSFGGKDMFIDIGAEQLLAAQKENTLIAVEIKSFTGLSEVDDMHKALGQFLAYRVVLGKAEPGRTLFMAVPVRIIEDFFRTPYGKLLIESYSVTIIGFDPKTEEVKEWIR